MFREISSYKNNLIVNNINCKFVLRDSIYWIVSKNFTNLCSIGKALITFDVSDMPPDPSPLTGQIKLGFITRSTWNVRTLLL
jgi:hypothetical protein